ncbi:hypothetical protein [Paraburkholderia sp. J12]|nr:hypothetical protein [Paraburkholderia sp. J12]
MPAAFERFKKDGATMYENSFVCPDNLYEMQKKTFARFLIGFFHAQGRAS